MLVAFPCERTEAPQVKRARRVRHCDVEGCRLSRRQCQTGRHNADFNAGWRDNVRRIRFRLLADICDAPTDRAFVCEPGYRDRRLIQIGGGKRVSGCS